MKLDSVAHRHPAERCLISHSKKCCTLQHIIWQECTEVVFDEQTVAWNCVVWGMRMAGTSQDSSFFILWLARRDGWQIKRQFNTNLRSVLADSLIISCLDILRLLNWKVLFFLTHHTNALSLGSFSVCFWPTPSLDAFSIDLNTDVTLVTVPVQSLETGTSQ